jgi:peroxin-10
MPILGLQTLGEEYLALIPIDHRRLVPSFARRAVLIFLYVIAPPLCTRLLASVHSRLLLDNRLFGRFDPNPRARQSIDAILKFVLTTLPTSVTRAHLALFYIYGVYYHLSWRTTGTRHLTFRPDTTNPTALRIFRWLGYLSIFQLAFSCALWIGEHVKSSSKGSVSIVDQTTG